MRSRRPFRRLARTGRDRRDDESFTLELVLQAVDRTCACDDLARRRRLQAGTRAGERRPGEKALPIARLRPSHSHHRGRVDVVAAPAPWKPRRDAKRRSRIVEEHRRRKGDPVAGGSTRVPSNDRLSPTGARLSPTRLPARQVVRGIFGYWLQTPPKLFRATSMVGSSGSNVGFTG